MKVLSYKNLIMRFFFCATGSRLYVMSTGVCMQKLKELDRAFCTKEKLKKLDYSLSR